ncbi:unnamed protein product [Albugo candida]|uniref:Uncharacterized protein n=1 Tax=Albugo candida TaxID=65357 RepID=A0A024GEW7_9STRA|nr:unnamed protein product [Albugo candida]|eukprot:CCI45247.1 unnamed protein product [Albugo candida]
MEPVTYFTGFGVSIIGKLDKLIYRAKFNLPHFQDVTENVRFFKDRVDEMDAVLAKPVQLRATYLRVLRDVAEFTKIRRDPYYVSTVLDDITPDLIVNPGANVRKGSLTEPVVVKQDLGFVQTSILSFISQKYN